MILCVFRGQGQPECPVCSCQEDQTSRCWQIYPSICAIPFFVIFGFILGGKALVPVVLALTEEP